MKKIAFLIFSCLSISALAQDKYWQQQLNYTIDVTLNDTDKSLTGSETIVYKNNSPSSLEFIWFHIYPNAYKNETTAMFQQIKNDTSRSKKLDKYTYGEISGLNFKVNGKTAETEAHPNPQYIDVIKVKLPAALKPGESTTITADFKVKITFLFFANRLCRRRIYDYPMVSKTCSLRQGWLARVSILRYGRVL